MRSMLPNKFYTLITGASSGIGKEMAIECARRQQNLALVALPGEELLELAESIRTQHRVEVHTLETDLATPGAPEGVYQWALENGLSVDVLLNNAGFGQLGTFLQYEVEYYERMTRVNLDATLHLTRRFLEPMKQQNRGYILNVGSAASFFPVPHKSVYSASKAFVYYLSRAIQHELRGSPVHLCVLCPNGVPTNSAAKLRIKQMGALGKATAVSPQEVAMLAINALYSRKNVVIPGRLNRWSLRLSRLMPERVSMRFMEKQFLRHATEEVSHNN